MITNVNKRVVVLGMGVSGLSAAAYCLRKEWEVTVVDNRQEPPLLSEFKKNFENLNIVLGSFSEVDFKLFDLVVISPGLDPHSDELQTMRDSGVEVVGDIELFIREVSVPIVAITGSNGKSTVCDLLGHTLNRLGINTIVAGNIGTPVLDLLNISMPQLFVLELSSFQLETARSLRANVACVLNISPDHLDRHITMDRYAAIKFSIFDNAKIAIINVDENFVNKLDNYKSCERLISFGRSVDANWQAVLSENEYQVSNEHGVIIRESDVSIQGMHNGLNIAATIAILQGLEIAIDSQVVDAISSYRGLRHRCELVPSDDGIRWINDSKATNPGAAIAAIESFSNSTGHLLLIAGGDAKGCDLSELAAVINEKVHSVAIFGKDKYRIANELVEDKCTLVDNLDQAVELIRVNAKKGDTVLLAPACASIDMYKNYEARGEHFRNLVGGVNV